MILTTSILASLTATCFGAEALSIERLRETAPRVVNLKLERRKIPDPVEHDRNRLLRKRSGTLSATLDNLQTLYFLNATLGTPPQNIRLHLDTGSSDLWVNTPSSSLCNTRSSPCAQSGMYTANSSSTYDYVGDYFNISYVDGSGAVGDYATDTINVAGNDLPGFQFGIGYVSSSAQNIVGVGYTVNEVQVAAAHLKAYNNLPAMMVSQGLIAANAYSLWLDDLASSTGSILFGGVDQSRYTGSLVTLPIEKVADTYSEFFITMTGLSLGSTNVSSNMALGVLLDSGSSLTYLPNSVVNSIYTAVNASYQETEGVAFVPCSLANSTATMTFRFSDPAAISVAMSELVLDLNDGSAPFTFSDGVPGCLFGIAPSGASTNVLGDTFLRSAYVVYDLDSNQISLAQSNFDATGSDVVEIQTGDSTLPSAVSPTKAVTAESGIPGGTTTSSSTSSSSGARPASLPRLLPAVLAGVATVLVVFTDCLA